MSPRRRRSGNKLPRNVAVLSWVSFFADTASEMLYPVFPIFVTTTLGAPVSVLGLIEGLAEGTAAVGKAVSGWFADRFHQRRRMIALGYGISTIAKPLIGLAQTWPLALVGRFVDRAGKGTRDSPRDAIVAADAVKEARGRAFGFQRGADTAGAVAGPLLGLALYEALDHQVRPLFFFAVVPGAISVALVALVRERPSKRRAGGADATTGGRRLRTSPGQRLPGRYWQLLAFLSLFNLMNFSDALLVLRAKELGFGFVNVVLAYALFNASYAVLCPMAGTLSDRIPRRVVYGTGLAVFAMTYIGLGVATSAGWVWALFAVYGAYWAFTDGVGRAWVSDIVPQDQVGSGLGFYQGLIGACVLVAGVWAGLAWDGDGRLPLILSGSIVAVLAVTLIVMGKPLDPLDQSISVEAAAVR